MFQTLEEIKESGLVYVTDSKPGIYRKGKPGKFHYEDKDGKTITDEHHLARIKALVLPPAWTSVWISPRKNGYLQATGIDVAGRKQYRYHADWTSRRSDQKYFRLLEFGKTLPVARKRIARDLRRKDFDEQKVLAICLEFMQKTLIRIGNESYKQLYGSYGLSTLRNKHVKIQGNQLKLSFIGKKGVQQELKLNDKTLSKLVKKCMEIPGQDLFQYYTEDHERRGIDSGKINNYIKEITGDDFSAKDFRTWGGTLEALRQLAVCCSNVEEIQPKKKVIVQVLDCVASKLGNTRAVCKSSYVYPLLLEAFENDTLGKYLKKIDVSKAHTKFGMENDEKVLMQFLRAARKAKVEKKAR
ncbi:DNA topoisomerase IB [Pedobacter sp. BAL39]|uniref:DNA topoisomerase IB n=1 Tax=Pedobacter sp. BAL39 TaxID=391596 RepID=UPI000155B263|nr:DNA topoisomerase IB [Pedobacter sp. BAL39]EDM34277.1 DNA topoisomerase IB [Pedobacter sp. BAL39]